LLPINLYLHNIEVWDEGAIERLSKELLERAVLIWPSPDNWVQSILHFTSVVNT